MLSRRSRAAVPRTYSVVMRSPPIMFLALLLAACGSIGSEPTIGGEIDDAEIRLERSSGPPSVWLELENVGAAPCALVPMLAAMPPDALPVGNGRVVMGTSGDPAIPYPLEAYVELNGEPVQRGDGEMTDEGWVTVVEPGDVVRLQLAFTGVSEVGERLVLCNGVGDYEAGRFAVLDWER
jgi:hypothetical protein